MLRGVVGICVLAAATSAVAAPRMLKGPYLQDLAPQSITVMWQMDQPTAAQLTVEGPGGKRTLDVPAGRISEAKIEGLDPATRYR